MPIDYAIAALEDPNRMEEIDMRFVYDEERVQVIGMAYGEVLFVIITLRDEDRCRILSARKATRHEQDRYYAGDRETWCNTAPAGLIGRGLTQ